MNSTNGTKKMTRVAMRMNKKGSLEISQARAMVSRAVWYWAYMPILVERGQFPKSQASA